MRVHMIEKIYEMTCDMKMLRVYGAEMWGRDGGWEIVDSV
jgi:hypothetical protein